MTVSLFSLIVAQGAEMPVVDPRLTTHVEYASRVNTNSPGPATQADSIATTDELDAQPVITGNSKTTDAVASSGKE